jgi:hypothetical protein
MKLFLDVAFALVVIGMAFCGFLLAVIGLVKGWPWWTISFLVAFGLLGCILWYGGVEGDENGVS